MLNDYKINTFSKPVSALADRPRITAAELKAWFDSNSTNEIKTSINNLIDALVSLNGANEIGVSVDGIAQQTVFGVLTALKVLIDDRYTIEQTDTRLDLKFDDANAQDLVRTVNIDPLTGVFTITKYDGTVQKWDTAIEKVAIDVKLDGTDFVLTLVDGTEQRVSLAAFVDTYNFATSDTIQVIETVGNSSKNYVFNIRTGSIKKEMMDTALMTEITSYVESASASAARAAKSAESALIAKNDAQTAASSASTSKTSAGQSEGNALEYKNAAEASAIASEASAVRSEAAAKRAEQIAGLEVVVKSDIVNNLATGGMDKVLSAEQGKILQNSKVDKVTGKGLSTNDYSNAEKEKLASLSNYDDKQVRNDLSSANVAIGQLQGRVDNIDSDVQTLKQYPIFETLTLTAANWSTTTPSTYTVTDARYTADISVWDVTFPNSTDITEAEKEALIAADIDIDGSHDGYFVLTASGDKPMIDVPILIKIERL